MTPFIALFMANLKRRVTDGFAVGYNVIFPLLMIWLMGLLCKGIYQTEMITSYQYYGVVTVPFCIFLSMITAVYAGKDDAYANTADRILVAPVSNTEIVCSKIFSEVIVFAGCSFVVLIVSFLLWNVCSLRDIGEILMCYLGISFVTACIGTFLGLGMKDFMKLKNVLNIPILISAILGGCFYSFGTLNKLLLFLLDLSPLRWVNKGLFLLIYDDNHVLLHGINLIMVIVGCTFMWLAMILFKREEYGNGELPSYEK